MDENNLLYLKYTLKIYIRFLFYIHKQLLLKNKDILMSDETKSKDALMQHTKHVLSDNERNSASFSHFLLRTTFGRMCADSRLGNCDEYDNLTNLYKHIKSWDVDNFKIRLFKALDEITSKIRLTKHEKNLKRKIYKLINELNKVDSPKKVEEIIKNIKKLLKLMRPNNKALSEEDIRKILNLYLNIDGSEEDETGDRNAGRKRLFGPLVTTVDPSVAPHVDNPGGIEEDEDDSVVDTDDVDDGDGDGAAATVAVLAAPLNTNLTINDNNNGDPGDDDESDVLPSSLAWAIARRNGAGGGDDDNDGAGAVVAILAAALSGADDDGGGNDDANDDAGGAGAGAGAAVAILAAALSDISPPPSRPPSPLPPSPPPMPPPPMPPPPLQPQPQPQPQPDPQPPQPQPQPPQPQPEPQPPQPQPQPEPPQPQPQPEPQPQPPQPQPQPQPQPDPQPPQPQPQPEPQPQPQPQPPQPQPQPEPQPQPPQPQPEPQPQPPQPQPEPQPQPPPEPPEFRRIMKFRGNDKINKYNELNEVTINRAVIREATQNPNTPFNTIKDFKYAEPDQILHLLKDDNLKNIYDSNLPKTANIERMKEALKKVLLIRIIENVINLYSVNLPENLGNIIQEFIRTRLFNKRLLPSNENKTNIINMINKYINNNVSQPRDFNINYEINNENKSILLLRIRDIILDTMPQNAGNKTKSRKGTRQSNSTRKKRIQESSNETNQSLRNGRNKTKSKKGTRQSNSTRKKHKNELH